MFGLAFESCRWIKGLAIDMNIDSLMGCFDFSNSISVTRNSFPSIASQNLTIHSFPNPSTNYIKIELNNAYKGKGIVTFFDQFGREIKRVERGLMDGNYSKKYDVSSFYPGVYFITAEINGKSSTSRFIKVAGTS